MTRHDESLMWQYAADELEAGEAKLVELHLEECPECQDRLQAVEFARETLCDAKDALPLVSWSSVDARIGAVVEKRLAQKARRAWLFRGALATMTVAAAAALAFFVTRPASEPMKTAVLEPVMAMVVPPPATKVEHAEGLTLVNDAQTVLADGAALHPGDVLRTALSGLAFVHLPDASHLRVGASTQVSLTRSDADDVALTLERGRLAVKATHAPRRGFVVHSRGVTVNVVGTTFAVASSSDGVDVAVSEGRVRVESDRGQSLYVEPGQRVRIDARTGKAQKLGLTPSVKQELAEVTTAADAVSAVERIAADTGSRAPAVVGPARGGALPRLDPREASARQGTLPPEALAQAPSPKRVERVLDEPGTAFPSLAGGITKGMPPAWAEPREETTLEIEAPARVEPVPAPAAPQPLNPAPQPGEAWERGAPAHPRSTSPQEPVAPIQGGPLTMVVPTLPPPTAPSSDATNEWVAPPQEKQASVPSDWAPLPQAAPRVDVEVELAPRLEAAPPPPRVESLPAQPRTASREFAAPSRERPRPVTIAKDVESIFLGRAEASLEKGTCERYLLGLEEIAVDSERNERSEQSRILRARCFDVSLRPRQAMSEYRKYLEEYPVGRFTPEAREALGQ